MREYNRWFGYIGKSLFCIGIGGVLTYCIVEWSKLKLPLVSETIEEWIVNGQPEALIVDAVVKIVLFVSVISVLIASLYLNRFLGSHMFILTVLFLLDIVVITVAVARGEIIPLFGFTIWVTVSYTVWLSNKIIKKRLQKLE